MKHLEKMNETYWQHARFAVWAACQCVVAALTLLVHGLVPQWFEYSASARLRRLLESSMRRSIDAGVQRTTAAYDRPASCCAKSVEGELMPRNTVFVNLEEVEGAIPIPGEEVIVDKPTFKGYDITIENDPIALDVPRCPHCGINQLLYGCFCHLADEVRAAHAATMRDYERDRGDESIHGWTEHERRHNEFRKKEGM